LQQTRKAEKDFQEILMSDNTGQTYLDNLVKGYLADCKQEASYFTEAEDALGAVFERVARARKLLLQVAADDNYDYADSVCKSIKRQQNYCVELWIIATSDGREAIASAYKRGKLFFQKFIQSR
jgi:hypothetical protein